MTIYFQRVAMWGSRRCVKRIFGITTVVYEFSVTFILPIGLQLLGVGGCIDLMIGEEVSRERIISYLLNFPHFPPF